MSTSKRVNGHQRSLLRAWQAMETARPALAGADTIASRLMFRELKALTRILQGFGWDPLSCPRLMNLLPADDRGLTTDTVLDFLKRLQFRNGHDAMRAAEHADELLHPIARSTRGVMLWWGLHQARHLVEACGDIALHGALRGSA